MKPYQRVRIQDCGELLVPIPLHHFAVEQPHPYVKLGAPYGDKSPYYLRQGVVDRLLQAQQHLHSLRSGWRIQIFDAYRPIAVQQYMVDYTFAQTVAEQGLSVAQLTAAQRQAIWQQVHQFWAVPSLDPATPPPHSTGGAIDVTLVDAAGRVVDMGSAIDEMSPRSEPDYFADRDEVGNCNGAGERSDSADSLPSIGVSSSEARSFHSRRQLLTQVMTTAGFRQHPQEWWHFSYGDQLWAWLGHSQAERADAAESSIALYGAAEPIGVASGSSR